MGSRWRKPLSHTSINHERVGQNLGICLSKRGVAIHFQRFYQTAQSAADRAVERLPNSSPSPLNGELNLKQHNHSRYGDRQ